VPEEQLKELSYDECLQFLREGLVGRIGIVVDDAPIILPINYRLVEASGMTPARWIAIRTRPGNLIERAGLLVAFEIDGIDPYHKQGWSVLVRGTLHHVDPDAADFRQRFDSTPWILTERDAWLIIDPFAVTGRRLHAAAPEWALDDRAYR
jgi:nitroimidazol reductase NimA-like FMN-containing flavoprotein (pyridoxamine 5'-phosphate oxidase superfamily)